MTTSKDNVTPIVRKSALPVEGIDPYIPKEGEEYMNEAQIKHFQDILNQWKESLIGEVDRTVDHMKNGSQKPF